MSHSLTEYQALALLDRTLQDAHEEFSMGYPGFARIVSARLDHLRSYPRDAQKALLEALVYWKFQQLPAVARIMTDEHKALYKRFVDDTIGFVHTAPPASATAKERKQRCGSIRDVLDPLLGEPKQFDPTGLDYFQRYGALTLQTSVSFSAAGRSNLNLDQDLLHVQSKPVLMPDFQGGSVLWNPRTSLFLGICRCRRLGMSTSYNVCTEAELSFVIQRFVAFIEETHLLLDALLAKPPRRSRRQSTQQEAISPKAARKKRSPRASR